MFKRLKLALAIYTPWVLGVAGFAIFNPAAFSWTVALAAAVGIGALGVMAEQVLGQD